jgi:hypothetical protein
LYSAHPHACVDPPADIWYERFVCTLQTLYTFKNENSISVHLFTVSYIHRVSVCMVCGVHMDIAMAQYELHIDRGTLPGHIKGLAGVCRGRGRRNILTKKKLRVDVAQRMQ